MLRIHPHYVNTRFDSRHSDDSGPSTFFPLTNEGGFFLTRKEEEEYTKGGWLFDRVGFGE